MSNENYYGFDDDMFSESQRVNFHSFKNGEHKFRILPPYAPKKLFLQVDLHWGFTDENGKKKALKCTKYSHKRCAICDEVDRLKGEIELLKSVVPKDQAHRDELKTDIEKLESRVGDIKKKPTYLWNIVTENGEQKVLQLSWNGHDPLQQKVKFYWEQKKINVTDPRNSYLMFCSRTGEKAKTRFQYEVLENAVRPLEGLKPLIDLSKVYNEISPEELEKIVKNGYVEAPNSDPNDRNFEADMPSGLPEESVAKTETKPTESTSQVKREAPQESEKTNEQVASNALNQEAKLTADEEAERLMAALRD